MTYVTGFVVPVPKAKLAAYKAMARKAGKVWMKHGALSYMECAGDDVKPGKVTSFPQAVKLKKNETVIFAYVTYKSKAHHNRVTKLVFADPFMQQFNMKNVPFDGKRMFWGGFKAIINL
jgi:uncharacterized protein YbaA (DUF1428 family)